MNRIKYKKCGGIKFMKRKLLGILSLVFLSSAMSLLVNAEEIRATNISGSSSGSGYESIPHDGIDLGNGMSLDGYFRMGKQFKVRSGNPFTTGIWQTGRLANEGDSWNLDFHWRAMNANGTWIKVMSTIERREIGNEAKDGLMDISDVVMTNAYAKVGGFNKNTPDMAVWAGRRSVGVWHNSWLIDADLPSYGGTGIGIENIDVAGGKFELSYLYGKGYWWTNLPGATDVGYSHMLYLGYRPIKNLSFQIAGNRYSQDEAYDIKEQGFSRTGIQTTVAYDFDKFLGFLPGKSTALIQYSKGALETKNAFASKKDNSIMGTIYGDTKIADFLPLSAQVYYKMANDYSGVSTDPKDKTKVRELGSTVRVFIPVVENFMVQTEVGYGFIKRTDKETEKHMKIAVAPTLVVGSIYNVTPQFRLIGAYQRIENKGGSSDPKNDIGEFTIGGQVEISF